MTIHHFFSTGEAYDACQCSDALAQDGQTLLIEDEGVVGLSWAWPLAVTAEAGNFHKPATGYDPARFEDAGKRVFTDEQIRAAVALAQEKGFALGEEFKPYAA